MYMLLITVIYLAFISLGLPDSLLGSAWPSMYQSFDVPVSFAGIISMIIAGGTIVSSLMSYKLIRKLGTGLLTALSVALTCIALFGFSLSQNFIMLCIFSVPYGLGAGAVDAALNNFVASHFSSRHMNWLHSCWGIGASVSPYIMSFALFHNMTFAGGYRIVAIIQVFLTAILFFSIPLFKMKTPDQKDSSDAEGEKLPDKKFRDILNIKGVKFVLISFFAYCSAESITGIWATSYLVFARSFTAERAAMFGSLYFLGITIGRIICGFIADKFNDKNLIRIGLGVFISGIILIALPIGLDLLPIAGLVIAGIGSGPIYPTIIHSTPENFGKENSQAVIGIQMASAYVGTTFMPPLFGAVAKATSFLIMPFALLIFVLLIVFLTEKLNTLKKSRSL